MQGEETSGNAVAGKGKREDTGGEERERERKREGRQSPPLFFLFSPSSPPSTYSAFLYPKTHLPSIGFLLVFFPLQKKEEEAHTHTPRRHT